MKHRIEYDLAFPDYLLDRTKRGFRIVDATEDVKSLEVKNYKSVLDMSGESNLFYR